MSLLCGAAALAAPAASTVQDAAGLAAVDAVHGDGGSAAGFIGPTLLELTAGVVGRGERVGDGDAEQRARRLVALGAWGQAAAAWAEARRLGADSGLSTAWEIVSLAWAEQPERARVAAAAGQARDPRDVRVTLASAWLAADSGDERGARDLLATIADPGADRAALDLLRIRTWRYEGGKRKALRARDTAVDSGVADAWTWLESAELYYDLGDIDALADLDRATRSDGVSPVHFATLVDLRCQLGDHADAVRAGLQGMERFPWDQRLAARTVQCARDGGVGSTLDAWVDAEPDRAALRELRGELRLLVDDPDGAIDDLRLALDAGRDSSLLFLSLADAATRLDLAQEAHAALVTGAARLPWDFELVRSRFGAARTLGEAAAVLDAAERWRALATLVGVRPPADVSAAAVEAAVQLDRPALVIAWSDIELSRRDAKVQASIMGARAAALAALGQRADAAEAYEAALAAAPGDDGLQLAFAAFLLAPDGGQPDEIARARTIARAVLDGDGGDEEERGVRIDALSVLALAAWLVGDADTAVARQRQAIELAPGDEGLQVGLRGYLEGVP